MPSDAPESSGVTIRPARPDDVPLIVSLVKELAEYEQLSHVVVATENDFHEALFGPCPVAEALVGEYAARPVGFALFFHNFSTFAGRPGIYLEDLYVRPAFRGKGVGKALLKSLAALARQRNCARLEWSVLDWNSPAQRFYQSIGAVPLDKWTLWRLDGQALERLGGEVAPGNTR